MIDKGPCYECTERHPHCHKTCAEYASYSTALKAKKEYIKDAKSKDHIYTEYAKERYVRHRIAETIARKRRER